LGDKKGGLSVIAMNRDWVFDWTAKNQKRHCLGPKVEIAGGEKEFKSGVFRGKKSS